MITPLEIHNKQFTKSLRGYNEQEVKDFLTHIGDDYENVYRENGQLKEDIQKLKFELEKYRKLEETMNNTLVLAQQTSEKVKINAHKEAELILQDSKKRISDLLLFYQEIIKRVSLLNVELKAQISSYFELVQKNEKKIEEISDFFYSKDMKDIMENLEKISLEEK